jgi:hypothetical protein
MKGVPHFVHGPCKAEKKFQNYFQHLIVPRTLRTLSLEQKISSKNLRRVKGHFVSQTDSRKSWPQSFLPQVNGSGPRPQRDPERSKTLKKFPVMQGVCDCSSSMKQLVCQLVRVLSWFQSQMRRPRTSNCC